MMRMMFTTFEATPALLASGSLIGWLAMAEFQLAKERYRMASTKWDLISEQERKGLDNTPFSGRCSFCKTPLPTEGAFARHFIVPDSAHMNLGYCPEDARKGSNWSFT